MNKTFKEAKREVYSVCRERCQRLLDDFLKEKNERVCSKCSESCSEGEKIHRALRNLIEEFTFEAAKRCNDKTDIFLCLLSPYLTNEAILRSFRGKGKMKSLAEEMERSGDRLVSIVKGEKGEGKN